MNVDVDWKRSAPWSICSSTKGMRQAAEKMRCDPGWGVVRCVAGPAKVTESEGRRFLPNLVLGPPSYVTPFLNLLSALALVWIVVNLKLGVDNILNGNF